MTRNYRISKCFTWEIAICILMEMNGRKSRCSAAWGYTIEQSKQLTLFYYYPELTSGLHIVWAICFLECCVERFEGDVAKGKSGIAFPWNAVQSEVSIFICKGKRTVASLYPYENMLDGCWICRVQYDSFDDLSHSRCDGEEKQIGDMCYDFSHSLLFDVCKVYIFIL